MSLDKAPYRGIANMSLDLIPDDIVVNLRQDHIDRGNPVDCYRCPTALAVIDAIRDLRPVVGPPFPFVRVTSSRVSLYPYTFDVKDPNARFGGYIAAQLPADVSGQIRQFDRTGYMYPCMFTLHFRQDI